MEPNYLQRYVFEATNDNARDTYDNKLNRTRKKTIEPPQICMQAFQMHGSDSTMETMLALSFHPLLNTRWLQ